VIYTRSIYFVFVFHDRDSNLQHYWWWTLSAHVVVNPTTIRSQPRRSPPHKKRIIHFMITTTIATTPLLKLKIYLYTFPLIVLGKLEKIFQQDIFIIQHYPDICRTYCSIFICTEYKRDPHIFTSMKIQFLLKPRK
jgi:hypothetical protein